MGIMDFLKRRLSKVYIPLLMVNAITLVSFMYFTGTGNVPIFSVFCNQITTVETDSLSFLYLFDIVQMDSVTWFIDVLLIGYLFVWCLSQIPSKSKRVAVAVSGYTALMCLPVAVTPPHTWYLIDTSGFMAGILFAEYENKILLLNTDCCSKILVASLLMFVVFSGAGIALKGMILGRYMKLITIGYSISACIIVATAGRKQTKESIICKQLGALSFFIYLTHVKIANMLYTLDITNVAIVCLAVLLCSTLMYFLYSNSFSRFC